MFQGVVCGPAREMIAAYAKQRGPFKGASVLCSGNFSIETTLRMNGHAGDLVGCDVSTYTCALGKALAGERQRFELNLECEHLQDWPADAIEALSKALEGDTVQVAAAVSVLLELTPLVTRKNHYERRMFAGWMVRLEKAIAETAERVSKKKADLNLTSFAAQDAWDRAYEVPSEHLLLSFPPTYEGGYERLYKRLDEMLRWERPAYKELTSGVEFARRVLECRNGAPWILGAEERIDELEQICGRPVGQATRGGQKNVYLYSNLSLEPMVVRRQVPVEPVSQPLMDDEHEISEKSKLEVHEIGSNQANWLRQLFASVEVGQAGAQWAHAVTVDGKIIGVLMWQAYRLFPVMVNGEDRQADTMYMMADIAVPSVRYPRLSKLLLLASLAKETQDWLRKKAVQRVDYVLTTAFSRNPASMKYRGVYDLMKREKHEGIWKLNYLGRAGEWTLQQAMRAWSERHLTSSMST